jgi:hypothetical protein
MRSIFGMCALHSFITSPMQAERSAADGLNSANAAVESPLKTRTRAANIPRLELTLVIRISPRVRWAHLPPPTTMTLLCLTTRGAAVMAVTRRSIAGTPGDRFWLRRAFACALSDRSGQVMLEQKHEEFFDVGGK